MPKPASRQGLLAPVLPCPGRAVLQTGSCPWSEIAGIFGFLYHLVFPPRADSSEESSRRLRSSWLYLADKRSGTELSLSCCWLRLDQQQGQSFPLPGETFTFYLRQKRLSLPLNSGFLLGLGMATKGLTFPQLLPGGAVATARSHSFGCRYAQRLS